MNSNEYQVVIENGYNNATGIYYMDETTVFNNIKGRLCHEFVDQQSRNIIFNKYTMDNARDFFIK